MKPDVRDETPTRLVQKQRNVQVQSHEPMGEEMLKIEKHTEGCVTRLQLSGRFRSDLISFVRSAMSNGCTHKILDLSDITLVDVEVVRFLNRCDDEGIEVVQCPPYVREWMLRERAEERESNPQ